MWIFTRHGAVSIVRAPAQADKRYTKVRRGIQVRGRDPEHLDAILHRYCGKDGWDDALDVSPIQRTPDRDYPVRFYITRADLGMLLYRMAQDVDYGNFKDACRGDYSYSSLLHEVWDVFFRWSKIRFFGN